MKTFLFLGWNLAIRTFVIERLQQINLTIWFTSLPLDLNIISLLISLTRLGEISTVANFLKYLAFFEGFLYLANFWSYFGDFSNISQIFIIANDQKLFSHPVTLLLNDLLSGVKGIKILFLIR